MLYGAHGHSSRSDRLSDISSLHSSLRPKRRAEKVGGGSAAAHTRTFYRTTNDVETTDDDDAWWGFLDEKLSIP